MADGCYLEWTINYAVDTTRVKHPNQYLRLHNTTKPDKDGNYLQYGTFNGWNAPTYLNPNSKMTIKGCGSTINAGFEGTLTFTSDGSTPATFTLYWTLNVVDGHDRNQVQLTVAGEAASKFNVTYNKELKKTPDNSFFEGNYPWVANYTITQIAP